LRASPGSHLLGSPPKASSNIFAPFLDSLDAAEKAAAELLRAEQERWSSAYHACQAQAAEDLRRVRENLEATICSLSADLQEANARCASAEALASAQHTASAQVSAALARAEAAESAAKVATARSAAAALTLTAVRDATTAALRRMEA
jgi:hypothetical protein